MFLIVWEYEGYTSIPTKTTRLLETCTTFLSDNARTPKSVYAGKRKGEKEDRKKIH